MIEGLSIQGPEEAVSVGEDIRCSRRVVEEGELTKGFTSLIFLEKGWCILSLEQLSAREDPAFDDEQLTAIFTLLDHVFSWRKLLLLHGIDNNFEVSVAQRLEQERSFKPLGDLVPCILGLTDDSGLEVTLLVPRSEGLGTH